MSSTWAKRISIIIAIIASFFGGKWAEFKEVGMGMEYRAQKVYELVAVVNEALADDQVSEAEADKIVEAALAVVQS